MHPSSLTRRRALLLALVLLAPACRESRTSDAAAPQAGASARPGTAGAPGAPGAPLGSDRSTQEGPMISVRVFDSAGRLVGPITQPKLVLSEAQWRARLNDGQFRILRGKGTEPSFCGTLLDNKQAGVYACVGCGLPLFTSDDKFDSGTGWPSFFQPIAPENVAQKSDVSHGMTRTEILCARCDGHLGHVFDDGPRPTGLRFCLNSESLSFTDEAALASLADPAAAGGDKPQAPSPARSAAGGADASATAGASDTAGASATAVFAGGCFWCVEAVFEELDGVSEVLSGYAGGAAETANYEAVCSGTTGHAEAVQITYDPQRIRYEDLLEVHFATHDATQLNRQGADVGTQYRSAIFYADAAEHARAQAFLQRLAASGTYARDIVTTLEPLTTFHPAEPYHQDFVCNNPMQGYVQGVALPKVMKVRAKFADKLKQVSPLDQ